MNTRFRFWHLIVLAGLALILSGCAGTPELAAPGVTITVDPAGQPKQINTGVQLMVLITVLTLAPTILILTTSFTRIVIVLSLLRNAIGTPTAPPNQVIVGLALFLTLFVMAPTFTKMDKDALQPYLKNQIDQPTAFKRAMDPMRAFMFKQTREKDLSLFLQMSGQTQQPETLDDIPSTVLLPAFVISELKTAFIMGFVVYIPFLVIEMVVSSILLAMGMMMLPPSLVSLPFKILLFVLVDGWYLLSQSLILSFR